MGMKSKNVKDTLPTPETFLISPHSLRQLTNRRPANANMIMPREPWRLSSWPVPAGGEVAGRSTSLTS